MLKDYYYAEENTFFFLRGLKGGPVFFRFDVKSVKSSELLMSLNNCHIVPKKWLTLKGTKTSKKLFTNLRPDSDSLGKIMRDTIFSFFKFCF